MTTATATFKPYTYEIGANRYGGHCVCGTYVAAGDGFYWNGRLTCSVPGALGDLGGICERYADIEIAAAKAAAEARATFVAPEPTAADVARNARRAAEDAAWTAKGLTRCDRCGGAGGASHWPGFTCYDCGGHGAVAAH